MTHTKQDLAAALAEVLGRIAPDIDVADIDRDGDLREEFDIDSMDFLNFVLGVHERLGIEIPEADYPHLFTLDGAVEYLAARLDRTQARNS